MIPWGAALEEILDLVDQVVEVVAVEGRGDSITYDYLIATRLAELGEREQVRAGNWNSNG